MTFSWRKKPYGFASLFVPLLTLGLTGTAWYYSNLNVNNLREARFREINDRINQKILDDVSIYKMALVHITSLLFHSNSASFNDFKNYLQSMDLPDASDAIDAIGFAPRVSFADLKQFIRKRQMEEPDYSVRPVSKREEYFPVQWLDVRRAKTRERLGFDLFSDPLRREAMQRAQDTARPTFTQKIHFKTMEGRLDGFLLLVPLFKKNAVSESVEWRRKNLAGFVYGRFYTPRFFERIFSDLRTKQLVFSVIWDQQNEKERQVLYQTRPGDVSLGSGVLNQTVVLPVGGRQWVIQSSALPAFSIGFSEVIPPVILVLGIILSLLLIRVQVRTSRNSSEIEKNGTQLRLITNALPVLIAYVDTQERYVFVNKCYEEWFGRPSTEILGMTIRELLGDRVYGKIKDHIRRVLSGEEASFDTKIEYDNGKIRFIHGSYVPDFDKSGHLLGYVTLVSDITERKEAELRLLDRETRYRLVRQAINEAIWDWDVEEDTIDWNEGFLSLAGYRPEDIGKSSLWWHDNIHPEDRNRVIEGIRRAIEKREKIWSDEYRFRKRDGSYARVVDRGCVVQDSEGRVVRMIGAMMDVTERKRSEDELRKAKDAAEQANQAKTKFLANMSHEVRTPLTAILGFADLASSKKLDAEGISWISRIRSNGEHLLRLMDEILDLSRVEAGKIKIKKERFALDVLLDDFEETFSEMSQKKGLQFELRRGALLPEQIFTDSTRLKQIVLNVVGNAIKFCERGRVHVDVFIGDEPLAKSCWPLVIDVNDTGPGIDPSKVRLLFEPFSQIDDSTTRRFGGTGLGLFVSRTLARELGGDLRLRCSTVGQGSTFRIVIDTGVFGVSWQPLPIGFGEKNEYHVTKQNSVEKGADFRLAQARVLLVEDSLDNQVLMGHFLRMAGADVDIASNGREGIERALQGLYDVILMDIQMPELDGCNATQELREKGYRKPIIALTAYAMREERERCLKAGCNDHLAKPIEKSVLIESVARYVSKGKSVVA